MMHLFMQDDFIGVSKVNLEALDVLRFPQVLSFPHLINSSQISIRQRGNSFRLIECINAHILGLIVYHSLSKISKLHKFCSAAIVGGRMIQSNLPSGP